MRLGSKIFFACSLVIIVLLAIGAWSLAAVGRLVAVNRDIATRAVPAVRDAAAMHDTMAALARLESRFVVLGDARYAALWEERAERTSEDLERLGGLLVTRRERAQLADAAAAFEEYRRVFTEQRALLAGGKRAQALQLAQSQARPLTERFEASLDRLIAAAHEAAQAAQSEAAQLEARTWAGVLTALVAALGLALGSTALIAHRLTRSLRVLSAATASVAAGTLKEPVRIDSRDEVAELAVAFNAMAARLRQLETMKETFLATVSHELRSPLTSMREAAHLLREELPGGLNPKQARLAAIIEESTERLLRLVTRILELSRLRAGMLPLEPRPLELDRVVARAVDELRAQAVDAGVTLELERVGQRFDYVGDHDRLVQVVVNLVSNALRFTARGGTVTVRVIDAGHEMEIQVEDTGVGIPATALPHIFGWYQQAPQSKGGTGLGLAIVRGLVDAHAGRVTVESQEGKGSRFTVLLPRRVEAP